MPVTPQISVVIATYNRAHLLPETLRSLFAQDFQDYETIVVDDGSTDDTDQVVQEFAPRLTYVRQENRGPSAARNLGVSRTRAPWIAIQDSDDLCAPNYLATLYNYAKAHSECGMVFANGSYLGGAEHHRETIIPLDKSRRLARQGVQLADLFSKSIVRLQAALIARSCYDAIGGHDESLRICMDLDLAFRILNRYPVAYLDEVVFYYRKHGGNISGDQELRLLENIRVIEKLLVDNPNARRLLGPQRVSARLAYRYYRLAKGRWRAGHKETAREALRRAIVLRPLALKYRLYQMRWT